MAATVGAARALERPRAERPRRAAAIVAALLSALALASLGWAWLTFSRIGGPGEGYEPFFTLIAAATAAAGFAISWRVPGNPVGPLVAAFGLSEALLVARDAWYWGAALAPSSLPRPSALVLALGGGFGGVSFVLLAFIVVLFPSGRLPSRRWAALLWAVVLAWVLFEATQPLYAGPGFAPYEHEPPFVDDPGPLGTALVVSATTLFFSLLLATIVAGLLRVRRAAGILKTQLKWVLLGGCLFLFYPFVCGAEVLLTGGPTWPSLALVLLAMASLPLGIAVGMLRYDLFDVDRALAATVVWAIVTTALALGFGAVMAVGGVLVGSASPWLAAVATATCALALAPAHRLVNRWVGARLYPARRAGLLSIHDLERRVTVGEADPGGLAPALRAALRDPAVRVGYVVPETGELVDAQGRPLAMTRRLDPAGPVSAAGSGTSADAGRDEPADAGDPIEGSTPIEAAGERIGLLVAPSIGGGLRRELAGASVPLVTAVRLRLHLARSLAETRASRARLVAAEDAARRRFERDLHDGAQQRLVSLGVTLRLAQRHLPDVDVADLLDDAVAELGTATAELRRLAHGLRPSVLDDGLAAALASLGRATPVPVELALEDVPVADPVATTAYYVVAESLANAVKHADAGRIAVRLDRAGSGIRVAVSDDGRGGADAAGTGLSGLRDRVGAVGGRLLLSSRAGHGTTVEAVLPCAS